LNTGFEAFKEDNDGFLFLARKLVELILRVCTPVERTIKLIMFNIVAVEQASKLCINHTHVSRR